jgi:hypothetical protein
VVTCSSSVPAQHPGIVTTNVIQVGNRQIAAVVIFERERSVAGKFELYQDAKGKFGFRLKASNGQIIAVGGGLRDESRCPGRHRLGAEERLGRHGGRPDRVAAQPLAVFAGALLVRCAA